MYMIEDMIDIGVPRSKWKSSEHRKIAQGIALFNRNVHDAEIMKQVCEAVNRVPKRLLGKVTYTDLVKQYKCPDVGIPV